MSASALINTARQLMHTGKGLLAMDESTDTCNKRFAVVSIAQTAEQRRTWRELIVTTLGLADSLSGAILCDETIRQRTLAGIPFVEVLSAADIIPGIKVDAGTNRPQSLQHRFLRQIRQSGSASRHVTNTAIWPGRCGARPLCGPARQYRFSSRADPGGDLQTGRWQND